jgi:hypothetical protein
LNLTQILYNILSEGNLSIPEIIAGPASAGTDARSGLLSFFQLPGGGNNFGDPTAVSLFQIDIWHSDVYTAEEWKEELINYLIGLSGIWDGKPIIVNIESDNGVLYEDDNQIAHQILTISLRWVRQ